MKTIIGWQVTRRPSIIKIDQSAFIRDLIKEEGMQDYNSVDTPIKIGNFIEMSGKDDYKKVDLKTYQQLIGKLMYLSCNTRPDISFVVRQLSKQNADPRVRYLKTSKRVVLYLKDTIPPGLTYGVRLEQIITKSEKEAKAPARLTPSRLIGYTNSNYANDLDNRKSVIGNCFFIHQAIVL